MEPGWLSQNLHPIIKKHLGELEKRMGFALTITSGYRHPEHNKDVGGVPFSEHTYDPAEGVDILCKRSVTRYKMVKELLDMGIVRIGIGKDFVHVGIGADKPQNVMWTYYQGE
jgi:hypothetical protein